MTGNEYQRLANRTNDRKSTERLHKCLMNNIYELDEMSSSLEVSQVIMGCLGLSGEGGEFNDMVKKFIFHGTPLDIEHLQKELGDVMWYVAILCDAIGTDLDTIMEMNIEKLKKRYPDGFDTYLANHRKVGDV